LTPEFDELLGELRGDGVVDSTGRFTLDPEKARAKMRRFLCADPRRYILELVQAAVLRGASTIDVELDADDMWMRFDGRPFRAEELANLYGSLFASEQAGDDRRALRRLALGINAAMGMDPKHVRIRSRDVMMELHSDGADVIEVCAEPQAGTVIHVRKRPRPGIVLDFFRDRLGRLGEERHLRERCAFSRIPISLDGEVISNGHLEVPDALVSVPIEGPGCIGAAGYCLKSAAQLHLLTDGVWISTHPLDGFFCGLVVIIDDRRLSKDVSQAKIVEDAAFERALEMCEDARWQVVRALLESEFRPHMVGLWRELLRRHVHKRSDLESPVLRSLAQAATWPLARGEAGTVTFLELIEKAKRLGQLSYSLSREADLPASSSPLPVINEPDELAWLSGLFGDEALCRIDLQRWRKSSIARKKFQARRTSLEIGPEIHCVAKITLRGRVRGEIGLSLTIGAKCIFVFVQDGCLLCTLEVALPMHGLVFVVEGEFTATDLFDDVVRDQALAIDLLGLLARAVDLFPIAVLEVRPVGMAIVLELRERYLAGIFAPNAAATILWRAGFGQSARTQAAEVSEHLVPALGVGLCPGPEPHPLSREPLFRTVGGEGRSLCDIDQALSSVGYIHHVGRAGPGSEDSPPEALQLGRADRRIVGGIFGRGVITESEARRFAAEKRAAFMAKAPIDLEQALAQELAQGALAGRFFDTGEGTRGYVCVTSRWRAYAATPELVDAIAARLVVHGREVCGRVFSIGMGPFRAVAMDDRLQVKPSWDGVVWDEALDVVEASLRDAVGSLLTELCEGYTSREVHRGAVATILLRAAVFAGVLLPVPAMIETVAFVFRGGERASIASLRGEIARGEPLEYIPAGSVALASDEPVLELNTKMMADLMAILGEENFVDATRRLEQEELVRSYPRLRDRPRAPKEPTVPAEEVVVAVTYANDGARGAIGIGRQDEPGILIDLYKVGRHIGTYMLAGPPPMRACFIDSKLPLDRPGEVNLDSRRIATIVRWCRRQIPRLLIEASHVWEQLDGPGRAAVWAHLRPIFLEASSVSGQWSGWGDIYAMPLFMAIDGREWSIEQLRPYTCRGQALLWLPTRLPGEYQGSRPLLVLDEVQRACLASVFELEGFEEGWAQEQARVADGSSRRGASAAPEGALVSRTSLASGGLECLLWLPGEAREELEVDLVADGWVFASARMCSYLPCAGVIRRAGSWALDALSAGERASVDKQIAGLYQVLCTRLLSGAMPKTKRPIAHRYLESVAGVLRRQEPTSLNAWQKRLLDRLRETSPVRPVTLAGTAATTSRSPSPATQRYPLMVPAEELVVGRTPVAMDPSTDTNTNTESSTRTRAVDGDRSGSARAQLEVTFVDDTSVAKLLHALVVQLRMAKVQRAGLLRELDLYRLAYAEFGGSEVARVSPTGAIELNGRHSLVTLAVAQIRERGGIPPMILGALASAIYSVINWRAEEVTDDEERIYIATLAGALCAPFEA